MPVVNRIADFSADMTEWRHDLHAHPELGLEEERTSDFVARKLAEWGMEVTRDIAKTGVVGTLHAGHSHHSLGLRADMDALPIEELGEAAHCSLNHGVMHACGHDGHTTMLLGAARYLAETRNFDGTVHFIFQPAEEGRGGGKRMIEEGLFERFPCDAVYGLHNDPLLPLGKITVKEGPINAFPDHFKIVIHGVGSHAAQPHKSIDPVVIGAQIVSALQTIVARRVDPVDSAVVSVTQFHAGSAGNVIPPDAVLNGTVRTLKRSVRDAVQSQMNNIVQSIAAAFGANAEFEYIRNCPQVVNAAEPTARAARAAAKVLGKDHVLETAPPRLDGEDFAYMAAVIPSCFAWIGGAEKGKDARPLHHPKYDFNDELLLIGASYWATLVEQELPRT